MNETDFLIRGLLKKENFRFSFADTTCTVTKGVKIHDTDPVASKIFAEALTSAALLSPLLEGAERYSIRWDYPHGELQGIIADVDAANNIRGFIKQPYLMDKTNSEDDIFGKQDGFVAITKSQNGKVLNSGKSRAGLANPAADAGFFFSVSDQLETEIIVAVSFNANPLKPIKRCCGLLLQAMPNCDLKLLETYRDRMNSDKFRELLLREMPIEKQLWTLLEFISKEKNNSVYEFGTSPGFNCSCSQDKMKQALTTLGKDDLKKVFEQSDKSPKITCQFCHKHYTFKKEDFKDLLK
jgi:molecular chaperone Hsp33